MMKIALLASVLAAGSAIVPPMIMRETEPGLLAKASIKPEAARVTAQAKVPGEKLTAAEIENEDGKLQYSFEFVKAGTTGIDEVNVDAKTGVVLGVDHESPASESQEK